MYVLLKVSHSYTFTYNLRVCVFVFASKLDLFNSQPLLLLAALSLPVNVFICNNC